MLQTPKALRPLKVIQLLAPLAPWVVVAACGGVAKAGGQLELVVVDARSGETIPCRIHLRNAAGRAVHPPNVPFWHDHFAVSGAVKLKLPPGDYTFEIERGPEYVRAERALHDDAAGRRRAAGRSQAVRRHVGRRLVVRRSRRAAPRARWNCSWRPRICTSCLCERRRARRGRKKRRRRGCAVLRVIASVTC